MSRRRTSSPKRAASRGRHLEREHRAARFYENDTSLARLVADFLAEGFAAASPGIAVATATQQLEILRELRERSFDVDSLQRSQDLVFLDAEQLLPTFMRDGKVDAQKFKDQIRRAIDDVRGSRPGCRVRIFGQLVDILWQKGERNAAIRLELLWNQLAQAEASSVICGYAIGNFFKDANVGEACGEQAAEFSSDGHANAVVAIASDKSRDDTKRRRGR